jgi:hypothetical protein
MRINSAATESPEIALADAIAANRQPAKSVLEASREAARAMQSIIDKRKADAETLGAASTVILAGLLGSRDAFVCARRDSSFGPAAAIAPIISKLKIHATPRLSDIVKAVRASSGSMGVIPVGRTGPKDVWWMGLLSKDSSAFKVVGKIPLCSAANESYILTRAEKAFGFTRSLIVLATSEVATPEYLKSALLRADIPLFRAVDSAAIFNGTQLHLVEIDRQIADADDPIFKTNITFRNINIRFAGFLGGYFLPSADKGKIISFL